jgi:uncharacterized protein with GYD domain
VEPDAIVLELSDERTETLKPETLRQDDDGHLFCDVRGGRLTAQFSRHAMFDLASVLEEDGDRVLVRVGAHLIEPPVASDPVR